VIPGSPALHRNARFTAGVFFLVFGLSGCALLLPQTTAMPDEPPAGLPAHVELDKVPFFPQKDYECGPAALATTLAAADVKVTAEDLVAQVYLPGRKGSLQTEMLATARRYDMVSYQLAPKLEDVLREVAAGFPVIVLQDFGVWPISVWHYAVVVGYNYPRNRVILRSGEKQRLEMPFAVLEYVWKESKYWAMVAAPPGRIPATATESGYLAAIAAMERVGSAGAVKTSYTAFLARWPDNLAASIGLANGHYAAKELKEAEAVLRAAVERHPDSVIALNNLAQTLSDEGRNPEAAELIERAAALGGPFEASVRETRELIQTRLRGGDSPKQ